MKYIDLTEEQLADNFERVAKDFYKLIKDNDVILQLVTEAGLL